MIVDCGIYVDCARVERGEVGVERARLEAQERGGFVWIGLHEPDAEEFQRIADAFGLHHLAVEDAVKAHQRPKLERFGDTLFVVFKPARYVDQDEVVVVDEILVFLGVDFVVTVRHGSASELKSVRQRLDASPELLEWGTASVLYAVADRVVDEYGHVSRGLANDIDEIEVEVFSGPQPSHSERIFKLKREVLDFHRAVIPLEPAMAALVDGVEPLDPAAREYFRDVHDHVLRVSEEVIALDALLDSALNANVAQVGMRQNEDMRKISAWVAIVALPTLIAGIYGMNFEHMPELGWLLGYPMALLMMVSTSGLLYRNFKRRGWL